MLPASTASLGEDSAAQLHSSQHSQNQIRVEDLANNTSFGVGTGPTGPTERTEQDRLDNRHHRHRCTRHWAFASATSGNP
jgi:hypothetical protein